MHRHNRKAILSMKHSYVGSGGLFSVLLRRCGCWVPSVNRAHVTGVPRILHNAATTRLWPGTKSSPAGYSATTTSWCLEQGNGSNTRSNHSGSATNCEGVAQASLSIRVKSTQEMEETGAFFGEDSTEGDVVLLRGDLGTGKTCFARGFVRARVADPNLAVTSPSYLLDNTYEADAGDITIHHMDLYRLQGGLDLRVLDIPTVLETAVCLVEWPDRLGMAIPPDRLDVHLAAVSEDERTVTFTGHGEWWAGAVNDLRDKRQSKTE